MLCNPHHSSWSLICLEILRYWFAKIHWVFLEDCKPHKYSKLGRSIVRTIFKGIVNLFSSAVKIVSYFNIYKNIICYLWKLITTIWLKTFPIFFSSHTWFSIHKYLFVQNLLWWIIWWRISEFKKSFKKKTTRRLC